MTQRQSLDMLSSSDWQIWVNRPVSNDKMVTEGEETRKLSGFIDLSSIYRLDRDFIWIIPDFSESVL